MSEREAQSIRLPRIVCNSRPGIDWNTCGQAAIATVLAHARLGPVTFELLEPRSVDHTVAKFLDTRGPGLHHVSLEVADLGEALARCRAAGVRLIDEQPRSGAHASQVAFLHPKSLGGVLVELCQSAKRSR